LNRENGFILANLTVGVNDLRTSHPTLADQWHPTRNGSLTSAQVTAGSNRKVWWKRECRPNVFHEWETAVKKIARGGTGCPVCANQIVLVGYNDLRTSNLAIAAQWHPTRNGSLTPEQVTAGSTKKVWWKCTVSGIDHEWEAIIRSRVKGNLGCPICANKAVLAGYNDLRTRNPAIADQWHPTKNGLLTPEQVTAGSNKKVWWKCTLTGVDHEWESTIGERVRGRGCPICANKAVLAGYNDLRTSNPAIAVEWHSIRNGSLTAEQVTAGSDKKVWWKCTVTGVDHEWESTIGSRARSGSGCPICASKIVLVGYNDLRTRNPAIADQWHPTRNGLLTPEQVTAGSNKKVWWKCTVSGIDHEWEAVISSRSQDGNSCPICVNQIVLVGYNDLRTSNPAIADQWHPTRNGLLTPEQVAIASGKKVWWKCTVTGIDHEWEAVICSRTRGNHNGCPVCANQIVLVGYNDLRTSNPAIADQWHPTKNGLLTPEQVTSGSNKKVWWKCTSADIDHEWEAIIGDRSGGNACPNCSIGKTEKAFRKALEKLSSYNFYSTKIPLKRLSRKRDIAQIDMLNDELRIAIEYDGAWTHGENALYKTTLEQKLAYDKETTEALVRAGYKVVRIRNHDASQKLPFVPVAAEYASNVYQITYKSFGKDRDTIDKVVHRIIEEKKDWFSMSGR
jgi:very-short-patch-repair endonuclease